MANEFKNSDMFNNDAEDLVELIDENGEHTIFEHLATLEYQGESYLALCDPEADEDDMEVFILKIEQDEDGQDVYNVPDDDIADKVFKKFLQIIDDLDQE